METLTFVSIGLVIVLGVLLFAIFRVNEEIRRENAELKRDIRRAEKEADEARNNTESMRVVETLWQEVDRLTQGVVQNSNLVMEQQRHLTTIKMEKESDDQRFELIRQNLERQIRVKDETINSLMAQVNRLEGLLKKREKEVKDQALRFKQEIEGMQISLDEAMQRNVDLEKQIKDLTKRIEKISQ